MKKLLFLLMMPIIAFGQNTQTQVNATKVSTEVNVVNERDLVLSEKSTKVFTEFPDDMSMYTDILIIDAALHYPEEFRPAVVNEAINLNYPARTIPEHFEMKWNSADKIQNILSGTVFNIQNPRLINKKAAKKNLKFLQEIKNESYLYLYVRQSKGKGDDMNTSFMLRDYNRKLIYRATGVNVGLDEILEPLFNF